MEHNADVVEHLEDLPAAMRLCDRRRAQERTRARKNRTPNEARPRRVTLSKGPSSRMTSSHAHQPEVSGRGPARARVYEYAGHSYLLLADDVAVTEMVPISGDDARRVAAVLSQPHDHGHGRCSMTLEDSNGDVLHHQGGFATPQDATAVALVLLHSTARAHGARIAAADSPSLGWVDRHTANPPS